MESRLYHYTDNSGFLGIIQSSELWATSAGFLNDMEELEFGLTHLLNEVLKRRPNEPRDPGEATEGERRCERYFDHLSDRLKAPQGERRWRIYVACFCSEGDLLSQWRAYGSYALGFDRALLEKIDPPKAGARLRLVPVSYGMTAVDTTVTGLIDSVTRLTPSHAEEVAESAFTSELLPLLGAIKHPAFEEEREVRWICTDHLPCLEEQFRVGSFGSVAPYVVLTFPRDALQQVVVGPGAHVDLRARGARLFLDCHGYSHVQVHTSGSPLRV